MTQKIGSLPQWQLLNDLASTDSVLYTTNINNWAGADLTSAESGTSLYAVLTNREKSVAEFIELDSSTLSDYATTGIAILKRGLPFFVDGSDTDEIEITANSLDWKSGDAVIVGSDPPSLYRRLARLLNITIPIDDGDLVNLDYINSLVTGGSNTNRVVVSGKAGEPITDGQVVYFSETENEWMLASAASSATSEDVFLGIAQGNGVNGGDIAGGVLVEGMDSNQVGMGIGTIRYLSNTPGATSNTTGTVKLELGFASTATTLIFSPRFKYYLTQAWKDALAGNSGTALSASNKIIDVADTSTAKTANKIARRDANGDVLVATTPTSEDAAVSKSWSQLNKIEAGNDIGTNNGSTYFTNIMPFLLDQSGAEIGWAAADCIAGGTFGGLTICRTYGGSQVNAYVKTALIVGTNKNIHIKFVGTFTNGGANNSYGVTIETDYADATHLARVWYNRATQKMEFTTIGAGAGDTTTTDISGSCSAGTLYLFEIIHTAGVSTVLKINGTARATHDTAANIPNNSTVNSIIIHRVNGATTAGLVIGSFSSFVSKVQL
jgi:hypothetical protein